MHFSNQRKKHRRILFASIFLTVSMVHIAVIQYISSHKDNRLAHLENISFLESFSVQAEESIHSKNINPVETNKQDFSLRADEKESTPLMSTTSTKASIATSLDPVKRKINHPRKIIISPLHDKALHPTIYRITPPTAHKGFQNNPPPLYPRQSRRLGEQGKVVLAAEIAINGKTLQAIVNISSGYPRLDRAALESVLKWQFIPGKKAGVPQKMWVNIPINFVLE